MGARGRAITLIELLIVLAVALALGAVSLRGAVTWSDADRLRAAEDGIASAVLEARAEALRTGGAVELIAFENDRGAALVGMRRESLGDEADATAIEEVVGEVVGPEVLYELPDGMTITGEDPEDAEAPGEIVLVRLLPDGSASLAQPQWHLARGEERFAASIERWTGRLTFSPVDTEEAGALADLDFADDGATP